MKAEGKRLKAKRAENIEHPTFNAQRSTQRILRPRQQQVLALIGCGLVDKEVADEMGVNHKTVEYHVKGILDRTGAWTRAHAVVVVSKSLCCKRCEKRLKAFFKRKGIS